jgi:ferrous-iron efflux pump FieF
LQRLHNEGVPEADDAIGVPGRQRWQEETPSPKHAKGLLDAGNSPKLASGNPALRRRASAIVLGFSLILIVAKAWGWLLTGSLALLTSAADAMVDTLAALATFAGVRYAHRPADSDHRFGHGKGEALAAFTQAILLGTVGVVFGAESIWRLIFPEPLTELGIGLTIAGGSLVTSGFLAAMQTWVLRRTGSTAIAADRLHYLTDVVANLAVLAAFAVTWLTGWLRADPVFALIVGGYMIWNALKIGRNASVQLLDRELTPDRRELIEATVLACAGARAVHDLRTRNAGDRVFVEFHLEVDGATSVREGHDIVDVAEHAVTALFPDGSEVIGHLEPAGIADERLDDRVQRPGQGA